MDQGFSERRDLDCLRRLSNIRNHFAHCDTSYIPNDGSREKVAKIFDHNKGIIIIWDYEKEHKYFMDNAGSTEFVLHKIIKELCISVLPSLPPLAQ